MAYVSFVADEEVETKKEERQKRGKDPDWKVILHGLHNSSPPLVVSSRRVCVLSGCEDDPLMPKFMSL